MTAQVHLVGGVALETVEDVFVAVGEHLGRCVKRVPDGEVGPRRHWFSWQHPLLAKTPGLVLDPKEVQPYGGGWLVTLAPDVRAEDIRIGELGYAREARASYEDFKEAQRKGILPANLRFQVSLPTPFAVVAAFCVAAARGAILPAYERAMIEEVRRLCDHILNRDLAIQWDVCIEMTMWDGRTRTMQSFHNMAETFRALFARLSRAVPRDVELGYHLCYGDPEGKHIIEPQDCTKMVELANLILEASERPVAFVHLPMDPAREDDGFYAPLRDLVRPPGTEIYLGLVHVSNGLAGTKKRMAVAGKYLSDFGIATPCGMNRGKSPTTVLELMKIQADAVG